MSAYREAASGSWTTRIAQDSQKYITHLQQSIRSLDSIDQYLEWKFTKTIKVEILRRILDIELIKGNLSVLDDPVYRSCLKLKPYRYRMQMLLMYKFPQMYKILKTFKKRSK